MSPELKQRSILVALLLLAWAALIYLKTVLTPDVLPDLNALITQVQVLLGGVVGYHVGAGGTPGVQGQLLQAVQGIEDTTRRAAQSTAQVGHASIPAMLFAAGCVMAAILLAGCTTTTATMYAGYETAAKKGVQLADDNLRTTLVDAICGTPYASVQRGGKAYAEAVETLCGPLPSALTPAQLGAVLAGAQRLGLVGPVGLSAAPAPLPAASGAR